MKIPRPTKNKPKGKKESELLEFLSLTTKLPIEGFFGVARILCVPIAEEDSKSRPFESILSDLMDKFIGLGKAQKKELLTLLKDSVKGFSESKDLVPLEGE